MRRARWLVLVVVLVATVAGCTGVPGTSDPQVVKTVGLGEAPAPSAPAPPQDADPRLIVQGFLDAMATSPDRLDVARAYLDSASAPKWNTSTVTIVKTGSLIVRSAESGRVNVTYNAVGNLSATGQFTPVTSGVGVATQQPLTYSVVQNSDKQWRIASPSPGLYIQQDAFQQLYTPRPVYFLNLTGTRLVPDLRYSALTEPPSIESFLLTQLSGGPSSGLQSAVSPFEPTPSGNQRLTVTPGTPTVVQIPGAAALDDQSKERLAAQVAFTLRTTSFQTELQIQDTKQVVAIPDVGDTFDSTDFTAFAPIDETDSVNATFLRGGAVFDAGGNPLQGVLGTSKYALQSAVFDSDGGSTRVAATAAAPSGSGSQLLVGDTSALKPVAVPAGPLTKPVWAPIGTSSDVDEVWIASGRTIYRFTPGVEGARPAPLYVAGSTTVAAGTVLSLAFSPEGTRLALVIASGPTTSQVYTASVVRNGPDVQLTQPVAITPTGYQVSDVGWLTDTTLAAVAASSATAPIGWFLDFYVDGSRLSAASPDGLPEAPRSLAVSPRSDVEWITAGTGSSAQVWTKARAVRSWSAPAGVGNQSGYAPSYSA